MQSEKCIESLKYIMLVQEIIAKLVKNDDTLKTVPNYEIQGFVKEKYVDQSGEDITMMYVNVLLVPKFTKSISQDTICNFYLDSKTNELVVNSGIDMSKSLD